MSYKVRFVNPQKHYKNFRGKILKVIDKALSNGDLVMRGELENFEKRLARFCKTKYGIGTNSGYDALQMSIKAADIGQGDEVITVAHTFVATISAIENHSAKGVLVDVGKDYNMNMNLIEKAITAKTKAIIPVHLNGRLCNMDKLMQIAQQYNLIIIEDAAQALGGKFNNKMAGSFGLTGCFSFYPFKILGGIGTGGAVVTNNKEAAERIKKLRDGGLNKNKECFEHGYTAWLDNVKAGVLDLKLDYFPKWVEKRRQIADWYKSGLENILELKLPHFENNKYFDVYQNYVIRIKQRDNLSKYLEKSGVETLISWPKPIYKHAVLQPNNIKLPETEAICKEVVSLPMYPELTKTEVNYVIKCIKEFFAKN